ncbi:MAG: hypothetical protein NZ898_10040 [Myxococcota bacterium]|nr:hypothetical protein [Myxococcota bacterium]MDW8361141.1 hypothetical protein [Myxococcales bacterium]
MLTDEERRRHARALLLPEIGERGLEKLMRAEPLVPPDADARAARVALLYASRSGLGERGAGPPVRLDVPDASTLRSLVGAEALRAAAAWATGALAALDAVRTALGRPLGAPERDALAELLGAEDS